MPASGTTWSPAHVAAPHVVEFADRVPELLDGAGLTLNRARRTA